MPISVTIEGRDNLEFDINLRSFVEQHFGIQLGDDAPAEAIPARDPGKGANKPPLVAGTEEAEEEPEAPRGAAMFDTPAPAAKRSKKTGKDVDEEAARHVAELQAAEGIPATQTLAGGQTVKSATAGVDESDCRAAMEQVMTTAGEEGIERVMSAFGVERLRQIPPGKYPDFIAKCKDVLKGSKK